MAVHHGGKVGAAGRRLASKSSSKSTKSKAAKILVNHKNIKHKIIFGLREVREYYPERPSGKHFHVILTVFFHGK